MDVSPPIAGTVVLTGASGFIGRHLRSALLEAGADVVSLLRRGSPPAEQGRTAQIDYQDVGSLEAVMAKERPRFVFHVAGVTKGVTYGDFQRGNVVPTQNLLAALRKVGHTPDRFVLVSSLASYGPSAIEQPHHEALERKPVEFYGKSKLEAEQVLEQPGAPIPYTIIRPAGVYGPGDADFFQLFKSVAKGLNVFFGNRERCVSLVYVDDVIRAIIASALRETTKGKGYFICDGRPVTFHQLQKQIADASGRKVREIDLPEVFVTLAAFGGELLTEIDGKPRLFNRQKALMGKQAAWTCTHSAAAADFGYRPTVQLDEGVKRTFEWYRSAGWL